MAESVREFVKRLALEPPFSFLSEEALDGIVLGLVDHSFDSGAVICRTGDEPDVVYFLAEGEVEFFFDRKAHYFIRSLKAEAFFGESAMIVGGLRTATASVSSDHATVRFLDREKFEELVLANPEANDYLRGVVRERLLDGLGRIPIFSLVDKKTQAELADHVKICWYETDEVIVETGGVGDTFYIVLSGDVDVVFEGEVVGRLGTSNYFGEQSLIRNAPRTATIKAVNRCRIMTLDRDPFQRFIGTNNKVLAYFDEVFQNRRIQVLERVPLFSYLTATELQETLGLFEEQVLPKGEVVCTYGEEGDSFYVVLSGDLEVWAGKDQSQLVAHIGPNEFFGEMALVLGEPRTATVKAAKESRILALHREPFERFFLKNEQALQYFDKIRQQRRLEALHAIPLFNYLSQDELQQAQALFQEETFRKGEVICSFGDEGDTFYVVLAGELEVWSGGDSPGLLARLGPRNFFGELALVLGEKRAATVVASQLSQLLSLNKEAFNKFFLSNSKALEYFSKVICQRLASTVSGEVAAESLTVIAVVSDPGLIGKTMVANALGDLIAEFSGQKAVVVRVSTDPNERGRRAQLGGSMGRQLRKHDDGPDDVDVWVSDGLAGDEYEVKTSALVRRLADDYRYLVLDLGSNPRALVESARTSADFEIRIVDEAESVFGYSAASKAITNQLTSIKVVNLKNRSSCPVPINSCEPYVIPVDPILVDGDVLGHSRSPGVIPLHRLARKILGRCVGVAFGGGAAFGLSHLGVLKVFEENDIPIDVVVGCSMGSLVAVSFATGHRAEEMIQRAHTMGKMGNVATGLDLTLTRPGLLAGEKLEERFTPLLGRRQRFEDVLYPCRTVATDIRSGELVTIGEGRLEDAYRASSAVPVVLAPEAMNGNILLDGGVADPVPAETVRDMGADLIIAVNVVPPLKKGVETAISKWSGRLNKFNPLSYFGGGGPAMPTMFDITMNAMQILQHELGKYKMISADVRITPDLSDFTWVEFYRSHELIDKGMEAAEAVIPEIEKLLQRDPG